MNRKISIYAFVSVLVLAVGIFLSNSWREIANAQEGQMPMPRSENQDQEMALRQDMRKLWTEHVVWTRNYIISALNNSPDTQAVANRLLKNQEDIGNAVAVYYGQETGDRLTELLKQHILIAVDLINAAKSGDQSQFDDLNTQWEANSREIADFLSSNNPNWPREEIARILNMHLAKTNEEVSARLNGDYEADIRAYDQIYSDILMMADALSDGIIRQFPERF